MKKCIKSNTEKICQGDIVLIKNDKLHIAKVLDVGPTVDVILGDVRNGIFKQASDDVFQINKYKFMKAKISKLNIKRGR